MDSWKEVSSEMFTSIQEIKKTIKEYSYQDRPSSLRTDEKLCELFLHSLSQAKRTIYSLSDLCFSLQIGDQILPLLDMMRDELDILGDEIQARHCEWKDIPPGFMKKIIEHDLKLVAGVENLSQKAGAIFKNLLAETKKSKSKPGKQFWQSFRKSLLEFRQEAKRLVVLFRERETVCNINPLTLERSYQKIQEEIRERV